MNKLDIVQSEKFFLALADQNRLRILNLVKIVPMISADIEKIMDFTNTKANRHLRILKSANLLFTNRIDQFVVYEFNKEYKSIIDELYKSIIDNAEFESDSSKMITLIEDQKLSIRKISDKDKDLKNIYHEKHREKLLLLLSYKNS